MSNNIIINGNIGQPPEIRYTPSGMAVLEFTVASTSGKDDKKKTSWFNVVAFSKLAENVAGSVSKGDSVIVFGRMEQDEYTKKDGTKGKSTKVVADEVGVSCRWNVWVKDRTNETVKAVLAQHDEDELF